MEDYRGTLSDTTEKSELGARKCENVRKASHDPIPESRRSPHETNLDAAYLVAMLSRRLESLPVILNATRQWRRLATNEEYRMKNAE